MQEERKSDEEKPDCEKCPNCPGCPDQYEDYLS
ncbi:hypothetical protein ABH11_01556 [Serratia marcescens]|jgi:hypothetical protein|nr:hypothetical protein ABH11_01556 [Serratia marcescens]KKO59076.1 hypothetical protein LG59_5068 [Serratia ureilytica]CAI1144619.1 Uncharacterised protein [Serratia ficaria]AXK23903.1 Hypothetical protein SmN45_2128 [Serratia marcescens]CAF2554083.1 hypothetical protein AI2872V1_0896 [Serratia marcescens]